MLIYAKARSCCKHYAFFNFVENEYKIIKIIILSIHMKFQKKISKKIESFLQDLKNTSFKT